MTDMGKIISELDQLKQEVLDYFGYEDFPKGRKGKEYLIRTIFVNLAFHRDIDRVHKRGGTMYRGSRSDNGYTVVAEYMGKHRSTITHIVYSHETYMMEDIYKKAWRHFTNKRT